MSSAAVDAQPPGEPPVQSQRPGEGPGGGVAGRLGYLLKHAQVRLTELASAALAPYGLAGRELAVLLVLASGEPASQQQAARRLGVDRTTMVALVDALEGKGLVTRHPHAEDRRKNVVELTEAGRVTLRDATAASDEAERQFLAPLTPSAARHLKESLRALVTHPHAPPQTQPHALPQPHPPTPPPRDLGEKPLR